MIVLLSNRTSHLEVLKYVSKKGHGMNLFSNEVTYYYESI